ncbi:MAG: hypothetical protein KAW12_08560 [Candidatus Aminicenantes bacterium]|nr:hypothetical protein [Candidatus Aminicenantes bacterium]
MALFKKKEPTDLDLLIELEKAVGQELPLLYFDKIVIDRRPGYIVAWDNRGWKRVTGINLFGMNLPAIPPVIARFRYLEGLSLYGNQISDLLPPHRAEKIKACRCRK